MTDRDRPDIRQAALDVFGAHLPLAECYADLLVSAGIERGMIGPREGDRIWERHLLNSAVLTELISEHSSVVDLGSGAGLPGIPIAIARPDLRVVLLEPMQRRTTFLADCLHELSLPNVTVVRGRAESGIEEPVDYVVARAVTELEGLITLSRPLLKLSGVLLAQKGLRAQTEVATVRQSGVPVEMLRLAAPGSDVTVVRVERSAMPEPTGSDIKSGATTGTRPGRPHPRGR